MWALGAVGAAILAVLVLAGALPLRAPEPPATTGDADPSAADWRLHRSAEWGYTVRFSKPWRLAARPFAPALTDPREILSLSTAGLRPRDSRCRAFAGGARADLGRRDAVLTVLERGFDRRASWADFPRRPARPRATRANTQGPEAACGDRPGTNVHWLNFTDAGRHLHVLIVIGPDVRRSMRRQPWRILDTLRLNPEFRPDWPSSD